VESISTQDTSFHPAQLQSTQPALAGAISPQLAPHRKPVAGVGEENQKDEIGLKGNMQSPRE
jgi:hypothetical protein